MYFVIEVRSLLGDGTLGNWFPIDVGPSQRQMQDSFHRCIEQIQYRDVRLVRVMSNGDRQEIAFSGMLGPINRSRLSSRVLKQHDWKEEGF